MIEATGLALLHLIWQGAIVAGILAAALALMKRASANSRYLLSCGALALILAAGVYTAVRSYSPSVVAPVVTGAAWAADDAAVTSDAPRPAFTIRPYAPSIVLVWLAGVIVFTLRLLVSWRRTAALASGPTPPGLQHIVETLSLRLGIRRAVRLIESAAVDVPSVVGWIRPVILLPLSSVTGLTHQQLEMVLAHELAHIRRHDFLVNALQSVAETLLFYHPAAWWISRQIRIERENCCDDLAVVSCGDAIQYARALAQLEHLRAVATPAVAANGGSLFERVRRLVSQNAHDRDARGWVAGATILAFILAAGLTAVPVIAARQKPAPPKPPAPPAAPVAIVAPAPPVPLTPPVPPTPPAPLIAGLSDLDVDLDVEVVAEPSSATPPGKLSIDELIALRVHDITPEYIDAMRAEFGGDVSIRDVTGLKVMGVTPQYLSDLRAAGVPVKTAREATSLKAMNVTPAFVKSLADAGYTNLSVRDLLRMAAVNR